MDSGTHSRLKLKKRKLLQKIRCRKKIKKARELALPALLSKVDKFVDAFNYDRAVRLVRKGLKLYPDCTQLLDRAGVVALEAGHTDEAYTYFIRAVEISPDQGSSKYLYLGQLTGSKEAVDFLLKGIELLEKQKSDDFSADHAVSISSANCSLAEIYLTDECFSETADEECYGYCLKAISSCPSNPEAYQVMGNYLISKGKMEEATSTILKGVSLWLEHDKDRSNEPDNGSHDIKSKSHDPDREPGGSGSLQGPSQPLPSYDSRINCVKLLLEVGEHAVANQILMGLTREDDEVATVWYLMGWSHYLTKEFTKAKSCLSKVVKLTQKYECDEEEMIEHCHQLLAEIITD